MPKPKTLPTEVQKMTLNVPSDLHRRFKAATADQGTNMTDILLGFIRQYVKKPTPAGRRKAVR